MSCLSQHVHLVSNNVLFDLMVDSWLHGVALTVGILYISLGLLSNLLYNTEYAVARIPATGLVFLRL